MKLYDKLDEIRKEAEEHIRLVKNLHELNETKAKYLGKKGSFSEIMKLMRDLPKEEKPKFGQMTNEAKQAILSYIESQRIEIEEEIVNQQLMNETVDVTMPGKSFVVGNAHLLTQVQEEIEDL
ncbi:MAG: phenylalanine--tRNA ligase subunit alpha, partial [Candidatus Izimaplasma sp.]|nr:phenylalanine--tRNA ligase subunit alpha [Candidatus Izimaplasma bacterium]